MMLASYLADTWYDRLLTIMQDIQQNKCPHHTRPIIQVCMDASCIESNNSLLCYICLVNHDKQHKIVNSIEVLSLFLMDESALLAGQEKKFILDLEENKNEIYRHIDSIYKQIEESIMNKLHSSRDHIKKTYGESCKFEPRAKNLKERCKKFLSDCLKENEFDLKLYLSNYMKFHDECKTYAKIDQKIPEKAYALDSLNKFKDELHTLINENLAKIMEITQKLQIIQANPIPEEEKSPNKDPNNFFLNRRSQTENFQRNSMQANPERNSFMSDNHDGRSSLLAESVQLGNIQFDLNLQHQDSNKYSMVVERFSTGKIRQGWFYGFKRTLIPAPEVDCITFTCSRSLWLTGFGIFTPVTGQLEGRCWIAEGDNVINNPILPPKTITIKAMPSKIFKFQLEKPIKMTQDKKYTCVILMKGGISYYWDKNTNDSVRLDNGIKIRFYNTKGVSEGTNIEKGQIPELYLEEDT